MASLPSIHFTRRRQSSQSEPAFAFLGDLRVKIISDHQRASVVKDGSAYAANDNINDSPGVPGLAYPPISEIDRTFKAHMYYMWKPDIPAAAGMPGAIWVPLQEITWGFLAKAIPAPPTTPPPPTLTLDASSKANFPQVTTTPPAGEPTWKDTTSYRDANAYIQRPLQ